MERITRILNAKSLKELYLRHKSLVRFAIVGCINTGVDFLAFTILKSGFGLDKSICQIAGYSLGVANSFVMNKLWTFEDKKKKISTVIQLTKFILINVISLGITLLGLKILNETLLVNIYISKIIVTILAQIINFLGYKLWVFSQPSK